jgi:hypothetical protein
MLAFLMILSVRIIFSWDMVGARLPATAYSIMKANCYRIMNEYLSLHHDAYDFFFQILNCDRMRV